MRLRTVSTLAVGIALVWGSCMALSWSASAADAPRKIEVATKRFAFAPDDITLKKGDPVVLVFQIEDVTKRIKYPHLKLQTEIRKGALTELPFTPTRTGDFVGHCSHFCGSGHGSMTLTLHVTE